MNEEPLTNRLSIYLVKEDFVDLSELIEGTTNQTEVSNVGTLNVVPSFNRTPEWVNKFFVNARTDDLGIYTASAKAVLIITNVGSENRTFAVCFGYGKHILKSGAVEERFGLKTTLNIVDQNNLRSIDKTSLESVPKHSREQISQDGDKESFGLNIEQDLVRAISGKALARYSSFGKIVSGKDALYVTSKVDTSNLRNFLESCWERFKSEDYKENFDWIDQIAEIQDRALVQELDDKLIEKLLTDDRDKLWMATPEEVDWSDIKGFKYGNRSDAEIYEDLHFSDLLSFYEERELTLEKLKRHKVLAISADTEDVRISWNAYQCIYYEVEKDGCTYILSNSKWYEIDKNFVDSVNRDFTSIPRSTIGFPEYTDEHRNENEYNIALTEAIGGVCFDRDNISYGGGHSKIEFCDVFSNNKEIVHVKHYSGSSTLSHLFSQGAVSGEVYVSDADFRKLVNDKMPTDLKLADPSQKYKPSDQKIIFGVITRSTTALDVPFFSKISLRNAYNRLLGFGYTVEVAKILNTASKTKEAST